MIAAAWDELAHAVATGGSTIREHDRGFWSVVTATGASALQLRIEPGWAVMEATLDGAASGSPWDVVTRTKCRFGSRPVLGRVAFDELPDSAPLLLRGEAALRPDWHTGRRLIECLTDLAPKLPGGARVPASATSDSPEVGSAPSSAPYSLPEDLGLELREGSDGPSLELPGPDTKMRRARLEALPGGGVRVWTDVSAHAALSEASKAALGLLLVSASRHVRRVRWFIDEAGDRHAFGLEGVFGSPPSAAEIRDTVRCLAAAAHQHGPCVAPLADEQIARRYLSVYGRTGHE